MSDILIRFMILAFFPVASTSLAVSDPAPALQEVDVTGTWQITLKLSSGTTGTPTATFKQNGEKLTGTYRGRLGEAKLEGTLKGKEIRFWLKLTYQGEEVTVTYEGIVDPDSMQGNARFGESAAANWTAKRKKG